MATKRARSNSNGSLTGGTRDVNPQFLLGRLNLAAPALGASLTSLFQIDLPTNRLPTGGKPAVVEVLSAYFYLFPTHGNLLANSSGVASTADTAVDMVLTYGTPFNVSTSANNLDFASPLVITASSVSTFQRVVSNAALSPANISEFAQLTQPFYIDLTDGAGHGVLCAADTMGFYLGITNAAAVPYAATVKVLYRYKAVALEEYIGIVQSQQSRLLGP